MDEDHFLNQPYTVRMDTEFKRIYLKRVECGDENVKQKTRKVIQNPLTGSYGGENELDKIWTTHAGGFVLGWDVDFKDTLSRPPTEATRDDIEEVYLWFILTHDDYEEKSGVPLKDPSELAVKFEVRMFYPTYTGQQPTVEDPWSVQNNLISIYNETDGVWGVSAVHDHDRVNDCVLIEGSTTQGQIETVKQVTREDVDLQFENDSELQ